MTHLELFWLFDYTRDRVALLKRRAAVLRAKLAEAKESLAQVESQWKKLTEAEKDAAVAAYYREIAERFAPSAARETGRA